MYMWKKKIPKSIIHCSKLSIGFHPKQSPQFERKYAGGGL